MSTPETVTRETAAPEAGQAIAAVASSSGSSVGPSGSGSRGKDVTTRRH